MHTLEKRKCLRSVVLSSLLKNLEKEEQNKSKASRKKEPIKTKIEINQLENNQTIKKINWLKAVSLKTINKIGKQLDGPINENERTQITNIRNEREILTKRFYRP